jgi:hypothetical protein
MNEELKSYITTELKRGVSREAVIVSLRDAGWDGQLVASVLADIELESQAAPLPVSNAVSTEQILRAQQDLHKTTPVLKYFAIALIVIIPLLSAWVVYALSSKVVDDDFVAHLDNEKNSTVDDWSIYKNKSYKYKVAYPSDWKIVVDDEVRFEGGRVSFEKQGADQINDIQLVIAVIDASILDERTKETSYYGSDMLEYLVNEEVLIAGYPARKKIVKVPEDVRAIGYPKSISYSLLKDGHLYSLVINYHGESDGVGEDILSTFTFIE